MLWIRVSSWQTGKDLRCNSWKVSFSEGRTGLEAAKVWQGRRCLFVVQGLDRVSGTGGSFKFRMKHVNIFI